MQKNPTAYEMLEVIGHEEEVYQAESQQYQMQKAHNIEEKQAEARRQMELQQISQMKKEKLDLLKAESLNAKDKQITV